MPTVSNVSGNCFIVALLFCFSLFNPIWDLGKCRFKRMQRKRLIGKGAFSIWSSIQKQFNNDIVFKLINLEFPKFNCKTQQIDSHVYLQIYIYFDFSQQTKEAR